jgi:glycosyltransferase involved in cell wall biosynthesis
VKVLHVELGRHLYGGARQVAYLLDGIEAFGGQHTLVCAQDSEIGSAVRSKSVRVERLPFRGDADLLFHRQLRRTIRAVDPDIVHVHSRRGDMLSLMAARAENRLRVHSRRVDNPPGWLDLRFKFPICHRIITISEGIRTVLKNAGVPSSQLRCVLSAVDTERYRPSSSSQPIRDSLGIQPGTKVVAVVAQLIQRKGHHVLLDALPTVLQRQPDVRVLVFGKGPLEAPLKARVTAMGLNPVVRFEGFRTDMDKILPAMDAVVHPALMEGLGVSLLEAAASGVPIIASRAGGMPEIVVDGVNGMLVEPGDRDGLATAMMRLLGDNELRRVLGSAARARVLAVFSIQSMLAGNFGVYRELLKVN